MEHAGKGEVRRVRIDETSGGQRIDNFLLRLCKGVPKSHIYRILRSGEVRVNGGRIDASFRLTEGDEIRIPPIRTAVRPGGEANPLQPPPFRHFDTLHEDEGLVVINKPAGMAVHGGSGVSHGVIETMRHARPHCRMLELVHRLDRETSGVLLMAKKRSVLTALHEALRQGATEKVYLTLVKGEWTAAGERLIELPLHKFVTAAGERRVVVDASGKPARTRVRLLERHGGFSLLQITLETGRTHQIRVHLAHAGFPICGDDKYGDFSLNRDVARSGLKRMFLHAWTIAVPDREGGMRRFRAPLPAELGGFLQANGFDWNEASQCDDTN